ncbi:MAG: endonuclease/exonuclease/phosphatase family protein [Clostridia bacterium]|nr:endonuclease/exonuclease/phosphatase family protein [Clostridia bacterium]
MKRFTRLLWLAGLLTLCLCLALTACDGGEGDVTTPTLAPTEAPTEPATEAPTDTPTEEPTDVPTDAPTDAPTEEPTEEPTEPETEAPVLMPTVDLDKLAADDAGAFVTRPTKCEVSFEVDDTEGKFLRMTTKSVTAAGTAKPYILLELEELVTAMNGILPNTTEYPHVVLKVRANDLWSRSLTYFGAPTVREAANFEGFARTARVADSGDWQYVYLNLTPFTKNWKVLFLNFEKAAGKDGESMDLAEIHFFATAEEAATLYPNMADTYPIVEQTMENYKLKVMSFNVQTENGTSVDFDLRAELLRDLMDELQPDSIGMQEVTTGWIYRMDTYSFNQSYAGVGEGRTPGGEASSIYYRKDKFDLVDHGTFWLSETPDVAGSSLPNANYPRICTWARLKDKATGFEYVHINTHLDHNGNNSGTDGRAIRTAQVRVILEFIQTLPDLPMVFTGDFNQAPTSSAGNTYAMFKNVLGLSTFKSSTGEEITGCFADARADAADTVSTDAWASMTAYWQEGGSKYDPAHKPIDYVFYTPDTFTAQVYRNIHYHRDGVYLSDHLPQYCELTVKVPADGE